MPGQPACKLYVLERSAASQRCAFGVCGLWSNHASHPADCLSCSMYLNPDRLEELLSSLPGKFPIHNTAAVCCNIAAKLLASDE